MCLSLRLHIRMTKKIVAVKDKSTTQGLFTAKLSTWPMNKWIYDLVKAASRQAGVQVFANHSSV